jgi:transposase-like protein
MSERDNDREAARLDGNYMAIRYIDRLSALEAENERLRVDAERLRKHLHAPDRCPVCRWTNINLMNYGTTDESRWMCHGCAATALSDLARVREECELVREAMRQAQQTATRRLDECDRMRPVYEAAKELCDYLDLVENQAAARGTGVVGAEMCGEPLSYIQPSARASLRRETRALIAAITAALTPKEP